MTLIRISITIPKDVLSAADRRARALDRSRSWVVVEALRQYLRQPGAGAGSGVGEPEAPAYGVAEVAAARQHHFESDLRLSPAERLRRAEELARLARDRRGRGVRQQVIGFDSYEDFYEWKKARHAGA